MVWVLLAISILLLIGLIFSVILNVRTISRVFYYEDFYQSTLDDIEAVMSMLEKLAKRELISDDPDVKNLIEAIKITYRILYSYSNSNRLSSLKKKNGQRE